MRAAALVSVLMLTAARVALAQPAATPAPGSEASRPAREAMLVDRTAARFVAPETGGPDHPRFVLGRTLAFESRLEVMADEPSGIGAGVQERDVRSALEHDVAEQVLASLAQKLIDDSPADKRPAQSEIDAVGRLVSTAQVERLGGRARVLAAAAAEQLDATEVDALQTRSAFAAWYLDRVVTPLLHPSEEQLRDVYRTTPNPYRGRPFETIRGPLERWFVFDRVRVAEAAFLQAARSHLKLVVTP
jgi:hypothetical protein